MSVLIQTGQFALTVGSLTTTVNCNFQGKAIILFCKLPATVNTEGVNASFAFGCGDNNGNIRCISWASDDAVATSNDGMGNQSARLLQPFSNGTPTALADFNITSV